MSKYTVICAAHSFAEPDEDVIRLLKEGGAAVIFPKDMSELVSRIHEADGIVAGQQVYDKAVLDKAVKLKVISVYGVGYDKIDVATAKAKGIKVCNTPGANNESVSDLAMAHMLSISRRIPRMDASVKAEKTTRIMGREMFKKTLGVIGTGRVGKGVIKRAAAGFDMKILCFDKFPDEGFVKSFGGSYVDLDTLLKESDFITIHSPLTDETRNMISTAEFKKMKKSAFIVNTARGGIIDEDALYTALTTDEIAGAALDVSVGFMAESPLHKLDNCILTPHAGATTVEALYLMASMSVTNCLDVLNTGTAKYVVNP